MIFIKILNCNIQVFEELHLCVFPCRGESGGVEWLWYLQASQPHLFHLRNTWPAQSPSLYLKST